MTRPTNARLAGLAAAYSPQAAGFGDVALATFIGMPMLAFGAALAGLPLVEGRAVTAVGPLGQAEKG